jgi:hypothetical protein
MAAAEKDPPMDETLAVEVGMLLDRQAIERVLGLYCRAIDRLDLELLRSVYHPDGTDDHGSYSGNAQEFAKRIISSLAEVVIDGMHTVTHSVIEVRGRFATAESYYLAYQLCPGGREKLAAFFGEPYARAAEGQGGLTGNHDYFCGGRYIDLFEKRAGEWKILRRRITNEWNVVRPSSRITDQGYIAAYNLPGRRDRQDPVYLNLFPPGS